MSSTSVSILVPLTRSVPELPSTLESVEKYLQTTGFDFDVRVLDTRDGDGYGAMMRRGAAEAKGSVVVVIDPELPYPVSAIGDAVALIESGSAEVVFATQTANRPKFLLLRWFLVSILSDPTLYLKAFSSHAARLLIGESKQNGGGFDLELAYLANKYGFRVEMLPVDGDGRMKPTFTTIGGLASVIAIRMTDRKNGYRAPRRCPVCFSSEVWSWAQIPGNVVRACSRCKSRYLSHFEAAEDARVVRRELRPNIPVGDAGEETAHARSAREKTSVRRFTTLRKQVPSRSRILEIGVRDGSFGTAASREYEYVGIDRAPAAARIARAKGLEVYCSTLSGFVNTGPAFDAITLFHVFENMPDPHDALARMKELLKPGGALLLTTFDTEGLALSGARAADPRHAAHSARSAAGQLRLDPHHRQAPRRATDRSPRHPVGGTDACPLTAASSLGRINRVMRLPFSISSGAVFMLREPSSTFAGSICRTRSAAPISA